MINKSKVNDKRFWDKWEQSGAIGRTPKNNNTPDITSITKSAYDTFVGKRETASLYGSQIDYCMLSLETGGSVCVPGNNLIDFSELLAHMFGDNYSKHVTYEAPNTINQDFGLTQKHIPLDPITIVMLEEYIDNEVRVMRFFGETPYFIK